jgi:hypothetical protein
MRGLLLLSVLVSASQLHADDEWPQFRGPTGQGRAVASGLPWHGAKRRTSAGRLRSLAKVTRLL